MRARLTLLNVDIGSLTFGGAAVVRAAPKILGKTGNVISCVKGVFRTGPKDTPNIPDPTVGDNIEFNLQLKGIRVILIVII